MRLPPLVRESDDPILQQPHAEQGNDATKQQPEDLLHEPYTLILRRGVTGATSQHKVWHGMELEWRCGLCLRDFFGIADNALPCVKKVL